MSRSQNNEPVTLKRAYLPRQAGVFGLLEVEELSVVTLELPWRDNQRSISCVPEGTYPLRKRASNVVSRSTGGDYGEGWEVCDVPGRDWIMIHVGNWLRDTNGCVLPGRRLGWSNQGAMVRSSRAAFDELMEVLDRRDQWQIEISCGHPQGV